jgi:glycosyltransferase involved in cell wall biosynthesis
LKGRDYLNKCLNEDLNNKIYKTFDNPRVSVIIPLYNCQNSIKQAISSIQNQKMIDIEIILVNDKSNDDTLKIIEYLKEKDKRIKLINNKKNMGTLYSRSIGVLQSKGKYIFPLDNDDMFFDDNVFDIIYEEAYNFNYDIVGFKTIQSYNFKAKISKMEDTCHMHNNNFTIYKPQLSLFGISDEGRFNIREVHIWSKCIKNSIYNKAVNSLGKRRYSFFMSWAEDTSMLFVLFNVAESYRYITKYGIFKCNRKNSASISMPDSHKLFGEIFFLDVIFDFTKNDFKSKIFAVYQAFHIRDSMFFKSLDKININYLKITLKKLLVCPYINNEDKLKLKINFKEFT